MHTFTHTRIHKHTHINMLERARANLRQNIHTYIHTCIHIHAYKQADLERARADLRQNIHTYIHTCIHIHAYKQADLERARANLRQNGLGSPPTQTLERDPQLLALLREAQVRNDMYVWEKLRLGMICMYACVMIWYAYICVYMSAYICACASFTHQLLTRKPATSRLPEWSSG
jgi:hypothetical protein